MMAGSAPRIGGESGVGVALVVGGVVGPVLLVELGEPGDALLDRGVGGRSSDERLDLRAEEVVGARRAELGQRVELLGGEEVEHDVGCR